MTEKWFSKADFFLILAVLAGAVLLLLPQWLANGNTVVAEVTVNGETVQEIPLKPSDEKQQYILENGVVLETENGTIRFSESDCPEQACVHTGALSRAGEIAACVPNKTVVVLKSEKNAAVDGITY